MRFSFCPRNTRKKAKNSSLFSVFRLFRGQISSCVRFGKMQKVLTAAQMREVDRLTTERYGIPSIVLMENAAHSVARVITEKLGGSVKGKSILILCGKGNNGGDGAALARILTAQGATACAILLGRVDECQGDARKQFEILKKLDNAGTIDFWVFDDYSEADSETIRQGGFDFVVDALFGTGLTRELGDPYDSLLLDLIESRGAPTLAVDIPSGLNADLPDRIGLVLASNYTVTFTAPKPANVLVPVAELGGELFVANIGSPEDLVDEQPSQLYLAGNEDAARWLMQTEFTSDSYKNKRGHALLIAGSENYSGAAVLAGNAAMRSGVGLVTLAAPKECKPEIASRLLPEVILTAIDTDEPELLMKADSIAVGCGLDANHPAIEKLVREVVSAREVPVVVDAGALWFFNQPNGLLQRANREGGLNQDVVSYALTDVRASAAEPPLIFTPHEGEFLRLLGTEDKDAIKDRVAAVREFSQRNNVFLILKGERVLIGEPGGKVVVNPTGNSGLGKAGNGDTLTGILVGFLAQGAKMNIDVFETVVASVYVAGMAGDIAEKKYGKRVMTASDVRECLVEAFSELSASS